MSRSKSNKEKLPIYISLFNLLAGVITLGMLGSWLWVWLYWGVLKRPPDISIKEAISFGDFGQFLFFILPALALTVVVFLNFYSAYKFIKTREISGKTLTLSLFGWAFSISSFVLIGLYFIPPDVGLTVWTPILALLLTTALTLLLWKFSSKFASIAFLLIALSVVYSLITHFEELYCWAKGDEAEKIARQTGDSLFVKAADPSVDNRSEVADLSVSYITHMGCHKDFNFFSALRDELIP